MKTKQRVLFVLSAIAVISCRQPRQVNEDDFKMDLRYSPIWWQTAINLPDEVQKTFVDDQGVIYYDYINKYENGKWTNGPFNGCNLAIGAGIDSVQKENVSQKLFSSKVPMLLTSYPLRDVEVTMEAFAVAPALKSAASDSCELSKTYFGYPHNDLLIVKVANKSQKETTVSPRIFVKSAYPVIADKNNKSILFDKRIKMILPVEGKLDIQEKDKKFTGSVSLGSVSLKAGADTTFVVSMNIGSKAEMIPADLKTAMDYRSKAIEYWKTYPFPYSNISVPDSNVQGLVNSCIRNIYQAREIKKGLPAFQVGPTCYRGLWIIDGSFLLESMTFLGQMNDVRNGIEYMLSFQNKNGSVLIMDHHWKETGIVLWVVKRHAQLTGDKQWLESKWDNVVRAVGFIDTMRYRTMTDKNAPNYGLIPDGFSDGGLGEMKMEYTNVYWTLNGLKSAVDIAKTLQKEKEDVYKRQVAGLAAACRPTSRGSVRPIRAAAAAGAALASAHPCLLYTSRCV